MDNDESDDYDDMNTDDCFFDEEFVYKSPTNDDQIIDDGKYKILNLYEIITLMYDTIDNAQNVIRLPTNVIRVLLNHLKWDIQILYDRYFDDKIKLFKDANIEYPFVVASQLVNYNTNRDKYLQNISCQICYEIPINKAYSLECGHNFCLSCWDQYLTSKITQEDVCKGIKCAEYGCGTIVSDDTIIKLLKNVELKSRHMNLIINTFIHTNRLLRQCSAPDCFNAAKVELSEFISIKCTCGNVFCFLCGENRHKPVHCDIIRRWIKKCEGQSKNGMENDAINWLLTNTKECPKCYVSIEKYGGCNHMKCINMNCQFEFCWLCLKKYDGKHVGCNRYNAFSTDTVKTQSRLMRFNVKFDMKFNVRFYHFWNRFQNHKRSLEKEKKLKEKLYLKVSDLQICNFDIQYMTDAIAILCECRETLMYSYVFAYYLRKSHISEIFELNQEHLEISTERLSRYLEMELNNLRSKVMKLKVIDCSDHSRIRRYKLIKHINDGYEISYWEFSTND